MYLGRNVDLEYLLENRYASIPTKGFLFYSSNIGNTTLYRHTISIGHHRSKPENTNELSFNPISGSTNHSFLLG